MECFTLTKDLMFGSQCQTAVQAAGFPHSTALSLEQLVARAPEAYFVLIDLSLPKLDISSALQQLGRAPHPPARILAIGPHVQAAKLDAARAAGCDRVLSKGEASQQLARVLGELGLEPPIKPA